MKKLLTLGAFVLALTLPLSTAQAHNHGGEKSGDRGAAYFEKMDTNGDGVISKDEFLAKSGDRFNKMDTNGDGVLTKEEMKENAQKWREMKKERKDQKEYKKKDKSAE